ncbi:hypothetical protein ACFVZ3_32960 [Kitasatospora purpeofusca]|uniref:hypothetical protein n=1 Tax=Kitasatospora purpeofusca TaxID=67352 RepID=UPI00369FC640
MSLPPNPLPDRWTINLHPVHNLTILTLHDADGMLRQVGFRPLTPPDATEHTVRALEEITHAELRASAQGLIDTFVARTAQAQANAEAFGSAIADHPRLFERLRTTSPGCLVDLGIDDDALTVVLELNAEGPAAGALLSLVARWPGSATPDGPAEGVDQNLDAGTLTVRLDQARAEDFLTWYRDQH